LYLGKNDDKRAVPFLNYLKCALTKLQNLTCYGPGYQNYKYTVLSSLISRHNIFKIIRRIYGRENPDVIILDAYWPPCCQWSNLDKIKIPKVLLVSDPQEAPLDKIEYINRNNIDLALFAYKHNISGFEDKINSKIGWLPWSVNTNVFKPYGLDRKYDITLLGSMNPNVYPLRTKIRDELYKHSNIQFFTQKGPSSSWNLNPKKVLIRESYARIISQSKIFIFDTSIYNYAVGKFYEGMACETLVMAPIPFNSIELHFQPNYNFVPIDEYNFIEKIEYFLLHEAEREEIARRGYETVTKYHTTEIRAERLVDYLEEIIM